MRSETLQSVLYSDQRLAGCELREEDDHGVHLYLNGQRVATFGERSTYQEIRAEADRLIRKL